MKHRYHLEYILPPKNEVFYIDYSKTFFQKHPDRIKESLENTLNKKIGIWGIVITKLIRIY